MPTYSGFLYLSVVINAYILRVVGRSVANHLRSELVTDALDMALYQRKPGEVIHHSDQRSHIKVAFGKRCRQAGVKPSMGSVGDCYDNALCESFFESLECELLDRRRLATKAEVRLALFQYIKGFYNTRRRHSSLGYMSPTKYERRFKKPLEYQILNRPRKQSNIRVMNLIDSYGFFDQRFGKIAILF